MLRSSHMSDNIAKTVSTIGVWVCLMIIFVGGVFRFNWTGLEAGFLWAVVSSALAIAPAIATWAIWNGGQRSKAKEKEGLKD